MFFRLVVEIEEKSKIVLASRAENLIGNVFVIREANRRQLNSPGCWGCSRRRSVATCCCCCCCCGSDAFCCGSVRSAASRWSPWGAPPTAPAMLSCSVSLVSRVCWGQRLCQRASSVFVSRLSSASRWVSHYWNSSSSACRWCLRTFASATSPPTNCCRATISCYRLWTKIDQARQLHADRHCLDIAYDWSAERLAKLFRWVEPDSRRFVDALVPEVSHRSCAISQHDWRIRCRVIRLNRAMCLTS